MLVTEERILAPRKHLHAHLCERLVEGPDLDDYALCARLVYRGEQVAGTDWTEVDVEGLLGERWTDTMMTRSPSVSS